MKLAYKSLAKYYDLLFSQKDYFRETDFIQSLVNKKLPQAKSILDIGCGTGNHLNLLTDNYEKLYGVDLNREIIDIAKSKSRKIKYLVGSMSDFKIKSKFDVITCLYSVFNYNLTPREATSTLINIKKHLNLGGIVIVALYTPHNTDPEIEMNVDSKNQVQIAKIDQYYYDPKSHIETSDFFVLTKYKGKVDFEIEKNHQLRIYSPNEFKGLCHKAGFRHVEYFDNFNSAKINTKTLYPIAVIQ